MTSHWRLLRQMAQGAQVGDMIHVLGHCVLTMTEPEPVMFGPKLERGHDDEDDDEQPSKRARVTAPIPELIEDNHFEIARALYRQARTDEDFYITLIALMLSWKTSTNPSFQRLAKDARKLLRDVAYHIDLGTAYARAYYMHAVAVAQGKGEDHAYFRAFFRDRLLRVAPGWLALYDRAESEDLFSRADASNAHEWRDPWGFHQTRQVAEHPERNEAIDGVFEGNALWEMNVLAHKPPNLSGFGALVEPYHVLRFAFQQSAATSMNGLPSLKHVFGEIIGENPNETLNLCCTESRYQTNPQARLFWDSLVTTFLSERTPATDEFIGELLIGMTTCKLTTFHEATKQLLKAMFRHHSPWIRDTDSFGSFVTQLARVPPQDIWIWRHGNVAKLQRTLYDHDFGNIDVWDVLLQQSLKHSKELYNLCSFRIFRKWLFASDAQSLFCLEFYLLHLRDGPWELLETSQFFRRLREYIDDHISDY